VSNDKMAEMLNAIGQHIAGIIDDPLDNSYLNAEAGENWAEVGIFQDLGNQVLYHDPTTELSLQLIGLWDAAEPEKKWAALHYDIKNGRFDAQFEYADGWNPEETSIDRLERALRERYGNKPIVYPDPGSEFEDLTEADLSKD
jgi:hypothetical protein